MSSARVSVHGHKSSIQFNMNRGDRARRALSSVKQRVGKTEMWLCLAGLFIAMALGFALTGTILSIENKTDIDTVEEHVEDLRQDVLENIVVIDGSSFLIVPEGSATTTTVASTRTALSSRVAATVGEEEEDNMTKTTNLVGIALVTSAGEGSLAAMGRVSFPNGTFMHYVTSYGVDFGSQDEAAAAANVATSEEIRAASAVASAGKAEEYSAFVPLCDVFAVAANQQGIQFAGKHPNRYVGINTATPTTTLDVNGGAKVRGSLEVCDKLDVAGALFVEGERVYVPDVFACSAAQETAAACGADAAPASSCYAGVAQCVSVDGVAACVRSQKPTGSVCDDGDAATTNDACTAGGECRGEVPPSSAGDSCAALTVDVFTATCSAPGYAYCYDGALATRAACRCACVDADNLVVGFCADPTQSTLSGEAAAQYGGLASVSQLQREFEVAVTAARDATAASRRKRQTSLSDEEIEALYAQALCPVENTQPACSCKTEVDVDLSTREPPERACTPDEELAACPLVPLCQKPQCRRFYYEQTSSEYISCNSVADASQVGAACQTVLSTDGVCNVYGQCQGDLASLGFLVSCTPEEANATCETQQCRTASCVVPLGGNLTTAQCIYSVDASQNGVACDDGDAGTVQDRCVSGVCVGASATVTSAKYEMTESYEETIGTMFALVCEDFDRFISSTMTRFVPPYQIGAESTDSSLWVISEVSSGNVAIRLSLAGGTSYRNVQVGGYTGSRLASSQDWAAASSSGLVDYDADIFMTVSVRYKLQGTVTNNNVHFLGIEVCDRLDQRCAAATPVPINNNIANAGYLRAEFQVPRDIAEAEPPLLVRVSTLGGGGSSAGYVYVSEICLNVRGDTLTRAPTTSPTPSPTFPDSEVVAVDECDAARTASAGWAWPQVATFYVNDSLVSAEYQAQIFTTSATTQSPAIAHDNCNAAYGAGGSQMYRDVWLYLDALTDNEHAMCMIETCGSTFDTSLVAYQLDEDDASTCADAFGSNSQVLGCNGDADACYLSGSASDSWNSRIYVNFLAGAANRVMLRMGGYSESSTGMVQLKATCQQRFHTSCQAAIDYGVPSVRITALNVEHVLEVDTRELSSTGATTTLGGAGCVSMGTRAAPVYVRVDVPASVSTSPFCNVNTCGGYTALDTSLAIFGVSTGNLCGVTGTGQSSHCSGDASNCLLTSGQSWASSVTFGIGSVGLTDRFVIELSGYGSADKGYVRLSITCTS